MDVVSLLRLNIRRSSGGRVYADCPLCGDRRGRLSILPSENVWRCHHCGEHGGMLALYGKVFSVDNSRAYREICDTLLDSGFALEAVEEARPPKEMMDIPGMADELRRPMMLLVKAAAGKSPE